MSLDEVFMEMAYVRGSLINIDLDGDGGDDGFSFRLRNPPVPLGGKIVGIEIYVDDKPDPKEKVYIIVGERGKVEERFGETLAQVYGEVLERSQGILLRHYAT